jgi:hypothetical protein
MASHNAGRTLAWVNRSAQAQLCEYSSVECALFRCVFLIDALVLQCTQHKLGNNAFVISTIGSLHTSRASCAHTCSNFIRPGILFATWCRTSRSGTNRRPSASHATWPCRVLVTRLTTGGFMPWGIAGNGPGTGLHVRGSDALAAVTLTGTGALGEATKTAAFTAQQRTVVNE